MSPEFQDQIVIWLRLNSERFQHEIVLQFLTPSRQDVPEKSELNRIKTNLLNNS